MEHKDKLLIVFSNYNGMRRTNDLHTPRIKMTLDSFRKHCDCWQDLNVLLLDCYSNDDSHHLMKKYSKDSNWSYYRKKREDFYMGTLKKLVNQFLGKYKYLMIVDNDQYFFRDSTAALEGALRICEKYFHTAVVRLNEQTIIDDYDSGKGKDRMITGIYDKSVYMGKEKFYRSIRLWGRHAPKWIGDTGHVKVPDYSPKRKCWLYFSPSNLMIDIEKMSKVLSRGVFNKTIERNSDLVNNVGPLINGAKNWTWCVVPGISFNIGPRRAIKKGFKIQKIINKYERGEYRENTHFWATSSGLKPIVLA